METPPRRSRRRAVGQKKSTGAGGTEIMDDDDDFEISITEIPKITYERPGVNKPTNRRSFGPMTSTPQPQKRLGAFKMVTPKAISKTPKPTRATYSKMTPKATSKPPKPTQAMKPKNIWDKCIDKNPELREFIDKFNQKLEVANSTPLDII